MITVRQLFYEVISEHFPDLFTSTIVSNGSTPVLNCDHFEVDWEWSTNGAMLFFEDNRCQHLSVKASLLVPIIRKNQPEYKMLDLLCEKLNDKLVIYKVLCI